MREIERDILKDLYNRGHRTIKKVKNYFELRGLGKYRYDAWTNKTNLFDDLKSGVTHKIAELLKGGKDD